MNRLENDNYLKTQQISHLNSQNIGGKEIKSLKNKLDNFNVGEGVAHQDRTPTTTLNQHDFILLLTKQLENQDPTSPMTSDKMLSQFSQLTSLQGNSSLIGELKNLTKTMDQMSKNFNTLQSLNLLGKQVEFKNDNVTQKGVVQAINMNSSTPLTISGGHYALNKIEAVQLNSIIGGK